ncbi:hypothetical protein FMEXI_7174 [Fusarium mexicanum]|uniref:Uncharacterized protein n=1 Tax=Fusarium mexicanum TaxID=751941 RepID=A0A8H5MWD7_9HYPO|nr:hypothetical protein FMEXI_7174 [Fusarium mexicanum]
MEDDKIHDDTSPAAKYIKMLREEMADSADDLDITSPRQTPKEWLEKLTTLDFADPASVIGHRFALYQDNVPEFVLCTGKDAFSVSPWPGAMSKDRTSVVDRDSSHPGLLTLEFVGKSKVRPVLADGEVPKPSLPSVVLPIGQLRFKYETSSGIPYTHDTDYVLVVDAIAPGHPVWLIWDRLGGLRDERGYLDPETCDPVFKGVEKNFDAAQILPSIGHWLESYGNLNFNQLQESVKATGLIGFVKAKEATLAYVTELLGQDQSQVATDTMENNEISEARFAKIKAAVGDDPFKVHPVVYLQKLEEVTACDNSLDAFLRRAFRVDHPPPPSPLESLQKLAVVDFADGKALVDCNIDLGFHPECTFDLVTNGEVEYSVIPDSVALGSAASDSGCHLFLRALKASTLAGTGDSLPSLVLPIGVLQKSAKCRYYPDDPDWLETGYVIVVDAVAPGHPVWLVYNRNQNDECTGDPCIVDPTREPLVFEGIGHNFDAAQIFPSVHDWIQSYGNVDFARFEESIKATCITGAVEDKDILSSEVQELLRQ